MDNDTLSTHMVTMGNIRVAMVLADNNIDTAKRQVQGAWVALTHHGQGEIKTVSMTVEHLEYALQELEAIPLKELKNDIRILKATLEKAI